MKVSVIINCFNGEEYLKNSLESILNQSYKNWELIFFDNNSNDNSYEIFKSFNDERFKYFKSSSKVSLSQARNIAVSKCTGEWIGFCDCDDVWHKNKLEFQVEKVKSSLDSKLALVYGKSSLIVENNYKKKINWRKLKYNLELSSDELFYKLIHKNFIFWGSVLINKKVFIELGGIDPELNQAEDFDIILKIAKRYNVSFVQEEVFSYRIHQNNLTHSQIDLDFIEVDKILKTYLPDERVYNAIHLRRIKYLILCVINFKILSFLNLLFKINYYNVFHSTFIKPLK
jgi:glycosyltransferase involved in cell wall biosynthesis